MRSIEELKEHFSNIEFSDKYLEILNYIRQNEDAKVSIQGQAGSGKSSLLKIINYMFGDDVENHRMNLAIASSTGVASALLNNGDNIGATTIHSLFKLKPLDIFGAFNSSYYSQKDLISNIDCFIIDEISMVSSDLFDYIMGIIRYCRSGKPTRIILFGDCLQLQCVVKTDKEDVKKYYQTNYNGNLEFFSSYAFKDMNFATFLLTKIYRQVDDEEGEKFKDILNRIRVCKQTKEDLDYLNQRVISEDDYVLQNDSFLRIVSTNKEVQRYNQISLDAIDGKLICLEARITGNFRETNEFKNGFFAEKIYVKIGCPVMITRNAPYNELGVRDYYNGSMGILTECNDDYAMVDLGDKTVKVERSITNNYEYELVDENGRTVVKSRVTGSYENVMIKVCSASTVFKCQGLTLNRGYIDFGWWYPPCSVYVALSRFRSIYDFGLRKPLEMKNITATEESLKYVENAEYTESVYNDLFGKEDEKVVNTYALKKEKLEQFLKENNIVFENGKLIDKDVDVEFII